MPQMIKDDKQVRIRAMRSDDYTEQAIRPVTDYRILNDNRERSPFGLLGREVFGSSRNEEANTYFEDNMCSFIELCMPVVNPIVAGLSHSMLVAQILGVASQRFKEIMNCYLIYDTENKTLIDSKTAVSSGNYLYGGEYVQYLIEHFDKDAAVIEMLKCILDKVADMNKLHIYPDSPGNLIQGYSVYCEIPGITPEYLSEWLKYKYIAVSQESALLALLNFNSETLAAAVMNYIQVVPIGLRPTLGRRHSPLTSLYSSVLSTNNLLRESRKTGSPQEIARKYAALQKSVRQLLYKIEDIDKKKNYKPIIELLGTKTGHIRSSMLSKRVDFSGRSVIIADPDISVDECSVPKAMLETIMSYHTEYKPDAYPSLAEACRNVPVKLNRAPTLHRLSFIGYRAVPSDSNAIGLHPLACTGFNADHDGDTMGVHVPLSNEACREVWNLMLSTSNRYTPSSGEVTLMPRQELIYGLHVLSTSYRTPGKRTEVAHSIEEAMSLFEHHDMRVTDCVTVYGETMTLGECVIKQCFPVALHQFAKDIDKSNIKEIMRRLASLPAEHFKIFIDRIVKYAFIAATLYSPAITIIIKDRESKAISDPFKDFENVMSGHRESYLNGYDNKEKYNNTYTEEYNKIADSAKKHLVSDIGENNGYVRLVQCGARGDMSSLQQMFSFKGRIAKSAVESFNTVVSSSYVTQLSPLQTFISAYGTRKTLMDKSKKPSDTGDAMRRMMHTAADAVIVSENCGTTEGININRETLRRFTETRGLSESEVESMVKHILIGRYIAGSDEFITRDKAAELSKDPAINVKIRSPLTCQDPYCSMCYGVDLTYNRKAVCGLPAGVIAAQSIGEPGTQLTMRTFHAGGVSSKVDITSDFDKIKAIIDKTVIHPDNGKYDPVAWDNGEIRTAIHGKDMIVRIGNSPESVKVNPRARLKKVAVKGEGICELQGSLNINDILLYKGVTAAQEYMAYSIYTTYFTQQAVNLKHIEILVAEMTKYIVVNKSTAEAWPYIGAVLSKRETLSLDSGKYELTPQIFSSVTAPRYKQGFLSSLAYRDTSQVLSHALIFGKVDDLTSAFSNLMVGQPPRSGTRFPNYMADRLAEERKPALI